MNNYDDILRSKNNRKPFDKEEWSKKKQQDRNDAFKTIDDSTNEVMNNMSAFEKYLQIQSRFDKYSVGNAMIILAKQPNATRIKEIDEWKKDGVLFLKGEKSWNILEQGESYTLEDGTTKHYYDTRTMFDIAQTNANKQEKESHYDDRLLLKAFLNECPVDIQTVDNLDSGKMVEWNKADNVLYIQKGSETPQLFYSLTRELAKLDFESGNKEMDDFKSYCVSYMICNKYNINVENYKCNGIPDNLKNMESKDFRKELESVRSSMKDLNSRISMYFDTISKEKNKNKEQER